MPPVGCLHASAFNNKEQAKGVAMNSQSHNAIIQNVDVSDEAEKQINACQVLSCRGRGAIYRGI